MISTWIELISRRLGPPTITSSDEVRFNCYTPDCGRPGRAADNKFHMYVNPLTQKYFCQRCQRGGTLQYLTKRLGLPNPSSEDVSLWTQVIFKFLYNHDQVKDIEETVVLPDDYVEVFAGTRASNYLLSRGISHEQINSYQLGFGTKELRNRIIFPDYDLVDDSWELTYWVARSYGKHRAKYKNASVSRTSKVYNLGSRIRSYNSGSRLDDRVIICEGPISAIIAGYDAIATYGKYVTKAQLNLIAQLPVKEFIVAFDGDARLESSIIGTKLGRKGLNVKIVKFEFDEDPASVGYEEMQLRIKNSIHWETYSLTEIL